MPRQGSGDCGQLAELFARHPYEILLTHGHVDHCGGIYCFDDRRVKIRLNEKDRTPKPGLKRTVLETGRSIETRLWFVSPVCGWAAALILRRTAICIIYTGWRTDNGLIWAIMKRKR